MKRRTLRRAFYAVGAFTVLVVTWFALQVFPVGGSGREVIVTVHQGDSIGAIAAELHRAGVVASPLAFEAYAEVLGAPVVQPGSYQIAQGASLDSVRSILSGGPNAVVLTVVPGNTTYELVGDLNADLGSVYAQQFVSALRRAALASPYHPGDSLEGLIGPGSYVVAPGESATTLVKALTSSFDREVASVGLSPTTRIQGLSAYQLIVAASIDEKEGYYPKNMPKVARVIYNRLARGGPLQMDSTVLYALHQDGGTVTPAMLRTQTPYNTYLHTGLTPTPICVVSTYSLRALLHAPRGSWLYFVLINQDGTMAFSTTFSQQLANEALAAKRGL